MTELMKRYKEEQDREVDTEYSMTCIRKMSELIKTLSEKNEELYI